LRMGRADRSLIVGSMESSNAPFQCVALSSRQRPLGAGQTGPSPISGSGQKQSEAAVRVAASKYELASVESRRTQPEPHMHRPQSLAVRRTPPTSKGAVRAAKLPGA